MLTKVESKERFTSLTTTGDIFTYDIKEEHPKAVYAIVKEKLEARIIKMEFLSRRDCYTAIIGYEGFEFERRDFLQYGEAYDFLVNTENQVIAIATKIAERLYRIEKSTVEDYQNIIYYKNGEK